MNVSRNIPESAGMLTPLAPWISVGTPWAETVAARAAAMMAE